MELILLHRSSTVFTNLSNNYVLFFCFFKYVSINNVFIFWQDKDTDDSNLSTETIYFTPEIDISSEKTEEEAC